MFKFRWRDRVLLTEHVLFAIFFVFDSDRHLFVKLADLWSNGCVVYNIFWSDVGLDSVFNPAHPMLCWCMCLFVCVYPAVQSKADEKWRIGCRKDDGWIILSLEGLFTSVFGTAVVRSPNSYEDCLIPLVWRMFWMLASFDIPMNATVLYSRIKTITSEETPF
jgi:hypothetical protein